MALVLAAAVAGAAAAALGLKTDAGTGTLVDSDSASYKATREFYRRFGDEAVRVLVQGDLRKVLLTSDLGRLVGLEGCLSGNTPPGAGPGSGPCRALAELRPARVVYGPGTFVNEAANQIATQFQVQRSAAAAKANRAAKAARALAAKQGRPPAEQRRAGSQASRLVQAEFTRDVLQTALRYGLTSQPALNNPDFVSQVVFDSRRGTGVPKARFAYLFPSRRAALISIRLRPDLSEGERRRAIGLFKQAVGLDRFALKNSDARYVVSGPPVVVEALASSLSRAAVVLLIAALAVMAATLALVFRPPLRLLPLGLALASAGLTFGALALIGGKLTMATIAVAPVLIGLAVDYAIQFQARFNEIGEAQAAARRGGPVILTAGVATAAGFAVLLLSPVPMVRGFGALLVIGIVLALVCALTAGFAALTLIGPRQALRLTTPRWLEAALAVAVQRPRRVLAVAAVLAVTGWVADIDTEVVSDVRELVPSDLPALRDVNRLQSATGVSGEIDVIVRARDLTDPKVLAWMRGFQARVLEAGGFRGSAPSCARARLCPALSLPDLFRDEGARRSRGEIEALLEAVPAYFSQAVVTSDRRVANLAFGIRVMPLEHQRRLIAAIERELDPPGTAGDPPPGVSAAVAGLPVLAAQANGSLAGSRYWLTLAGLAAVAAVLLAVYRSPRRALVPLVPIVLATGWSALVLASMEIPLNPMSATLGALVIAIATEFSVLLAARYHEERGAGLAPGRALQRTYARTGAAVMASGATAIAGFAALMVSDIRMLRDFGFVTVIDLGVALVGVMLVLPAVLVVMEERKL